MQCRGAKAKTREELVGILRAVGCLAIRSTRLAAEWRAVLRREVSPGKQLALSERLVPLLHRAEAAVRPPLGLSLIATARLVAPATTRPH